jgi:hydroxymethylbilane synthase
MTRPLRIGTRGSRLALWQAHWVRDELSVLPGAPRIEVVTISTAGDRIQNVALSQVGGRDFFTKDIETALLDGRVDLAVHSLKDLATDPPEGLVLGAVMPREDPRDALLVRDGGDLASLPTGARVGTSSLRRRAFLNALRPDLELAELRGNVPTRVDRLRDGDYDALILATAGLVRLGLGEHISERLGTEQFMPAPAQGTVGLQIREHDDHAGRWARALDHAPTHRAIEAERRLLQVVEGGCQVPVGALAEESGGKLRLSAQVASLDGRRVVRAEESGPRDQPRAIGEALGRRLLAQGAAEILDEIREEALP